MSTLGFRTLHWLARNIRLLAAVDPVFARDLYIAAFRYRDKSTETTSMGGSQILPMSSHRKQDYDSGLYQLTEHYPAVLANNPHEAIDALLTIIDEYVRTEHKPADTPVSVHWNGYDTSLLQDYSSIWDEVGSQDHELKMLDAVQHFLEHTTDPAQAAAHLHQVAAHHPPAIIWRRLLAAGASQPGTIGRALRSLTWDPTILISYDTTKPAGKLLNAIGPTLTNEEHESIENAIMDIPTREGVNVKVAEQYRDRLLGCLDLARLVTDRARERYEQIKQTGGPPSNYEEPVIAQWGTLDVIPHNEDPVIGRLLEPVAAFAAKYLNGTPSTEEVTAILPAIKDLHDALKTADPKPWQAIENTAQCGVAIGRTEIITEEQVALLLPIILDITNNDNPPPDANEDQFSPVTGWSTAPRITAAAAITQLARHPSCYTTKTHDAIQRLSKDPVRAVRVQIVTRVLCLFKTDPDFMWELIEGWANNDQNPTVIAGALHALHRLPTDLAHRTIPLTLTIFARTTEETDKEVRDACVHIWVHLSLWAKDAASDAMLNQMLDDPVRYAADLRRMVIAIEGYLPAKEEHISKSAFALLGRLLTSVTQAMQVIAEANRASTPWSPDAQEQNASLFKCADTLAQRLYFVSGAFKSPEHEGFFLPPSEFYSRAALLLKLLAPLGHPHTAQYLVDTLMYFINVDPPGVLLLISEAVAAGNEYGYQYETLAEGLMVGIVERYLAEYRPLLRERKDCHTALMRILDVFVRVGWPSAHQLTYQLSDIYR